MWVPSIGTYTNLRRPDKSGMGKGLFRIYNGFNGNNRRGGSERVIFFRTKIPCDLRLHFKHVPKQAGIWLFCQGLFQLLGLSLHFLHISYRKYPKRLNELDLK